MYSKDEIRRAVHEGIKEVMNKDEVSIADDETFHDYGVDSLDRMNLILEIEKRLNIELGDIDIEEVNTINLLGDSINAKQK
jgi:acyl carrier protein